MLWLTDPSPSSVNSEGSGGRPSTMLHSRVLHDRPGATVRGHPDSEKNKKNLMFVVVLHARVSFVLGVKNESLNLVREGETRWRSISEGARWSGLRDSRCEIRPGNQQLFTLIVNGFVYLLFFKVFKSTTKSLCSLAHSSSDKLRGHLRHAIEASIGRLLQ